MAELSEFEEAEIVSVDGIVSEGSGEGVDDETWKERIGDGVVVVKTAEVAEGEEEGEEVVTVKAAVAAKVEAVVSDLQEDEGTEENEERGAD